MDDLTMLQSMRDNIRRREDELRDLRAKRDRLVVKLAGDGFPERLVGQHAGLSGPYVHTLKKRRKAVPR